MTLGCSQGPTRACLEMGVVQESVSRFAFLSRSKRGTPVGGATLSIGWLIAGCELHATLREF